MSRDKTKKDRLGDLTAMRCIIDAASEYITNGDDNSALHLLRWGQLGLQKLIAKMARAADGDEES